MGIALALFHRETEDPTGRVVLYSDFSRSYVVIDPLSQQLTLIDPGDGFGQLGDPERDVFVGAYSILVGALKSGRIPTIPVRTFVRSYANVRPLQVDKARLQLNFRQLELNAKSRKKTSIKRIFMRIVFRCLSIYLIRMIVRIE